MSGNDLQSIQSVDTEQTLIGQLLIRNDLIADLPSTLTSEHFYEPLHGRIFDSILADVEAGEIASPVTMKSYYANDATLQDLGGTKYIAKLAMRGAAAPVAGFKSTAKLIADLYARRTAIEALTGAAEEIRGLSPAQSPIAALEGAEGLLATLMAETSALPLTHGVSDALDRAALRTQAAFQNDGAPLISTGMKYLDEETGGFIGGEHWVLMGESSMGKTGLAVSLALNVARQDHGVLVVSLEMSSEQVAMRLQSTLTCEGGQGIEYKRIRTGQLSEDEFRRVLKVSREAQKLPIEFADESTSSLPKMQAAITTAQRKLKAKGTPLALVLVDYLQQVHVPGAQGDYARVSSAARAMKRIAKSGGLTVVSLSQMNNDNKNRQNKRPQKSDARNSGEIEESADIMIGLYRPAYYLARDAQALPPGPEKSEMISKAVDYQHNLEAIFLKARSGEIKTVWLWADIAVNRFLNDSPYQPDATPEQQEAFGEF